MPGGIPASRLATISRFAFQMLRTPGTTGAFLPSSPGLARRIVRLAGVSAARHVVEIGPGTGAFTTEIVKSLGPGAEFTAIEHNPEFVRHLRNHFPGVRVLQGCAGDLRDMLSSHALPQADAVVSGLPWANFGTDLQDSILDAIHECLLPGGQFATFAYFGPHLLPRGREFKRALRQRFSQVEMSPLEVLNLPPAFVYSCSNAPLRS